MFSGLTKSIRLHNAVSYNNNFIFYFFNFRVVRFQPFGCETLSVYFKLYMFIDFLFVFNTMSFNLLDVKLVFGLIYTYISLFQILYFIDVLLAFKTNFANSYLRGIL